MITTFWSPRLFGLIQRDGKEEYILSKSTLQPIGRLVIANRITNASMMPLHWDVA